MERENVEYFMNKYKYCFPKSYHDSIRNRLLNSPLKDAEEVWYRIERKNPRIGFILSAFFVPFDRIYLGDMGLAVLKLFTLAGFGLWGIVDWFLIPKRCRDINLSNFLTELKNAEYEKEKAEYRDLIQDRIYTLKLRALEYQMNLYSARRNSDNQHEYDEAINQIDNALATIEQVENEIEDRRIAAERQEEIMRALERQNELIDESNRISKEHAREVEFWNVMNYIK